MPKKAIADIQGTTDRRIDALLSLLAENSTIVISGAKIAREIGVTRQQVWRWIERLRALGVRVKGHPHTGYHIERMPDILAPQMLSHRLYGTQFARRIHHFFKIDSTNNVAMRLAEQGEAHGAVVLDIEGGSKVPSLLGLSMRGAIESAHKSGFELQIVGSGTAREQQPAPGSYLPPGSKIAVRFAR